MQVITTTTRAPTAFPAIDFVRVARAGSDYICVITLDCNVDKIEGDAGIVRAINVDKMVSQEIF